MLNSLINLPRAVKRLIFLFMDVTLIPICLYAAFALRYGTFAPLEKISSSWVLFVAMTVLGGGLVYFFKLPRIKLITFEARAMFQVGLTAVSLSLSAMVFSYLFQLTGPRSVPLIFGALFFLLSVLARVSGLHLLQYITGKANLGLPVLIYGGGAAGIQLASALRQSREARLVAFVDDSPNLHGLMISGLQVYSSSELEYLIRKYGVQRVLVAMPSVPKKRQNKIIAKLSKLSVDVQVVPSYIEMMAKNGLVDTVQPISPDELLGRDKVGLDIPEIAKTYAGRVVLVTGAGGSIGSELCRQLLNCHPARIILFEQGEYQLFTIDNELKSEANNAGVEVTARLGSVTNEVCVARVIAEENVEIIIHAAAYKHVSLVEENGLEGACNNVLGTHIVASAAEKAGIERFIHISTDKAVRPTNIMGATKRMAELVVQDIQTRSKHTKFAMVRFGNVLGSSGSVLPLFQKQIEAGGPVTVTHPDVTRFFMTIPEAARLVLLAGTFVQGGDVFVLDMGEPRKIMDIARQMITLSGYQVKDEMAKNGDIEIEIIGLRRGEKLYEELLIDSKNLRSTPHAKILRAEESMLSQIEITAMLREIRACVETSNSERLRQLIETRVEGYHQFDQHKELS